MENNNGNEGLTIPDRMQRHLTSDMDFLSPKHILSILRRNWLYVGIFAMLGALAGFFWNNVFVKPTYSSYASLFAGYSPQQQHKNNALPGMPTAADNQADVISLHRSLSLGMLLVGDYKELMTSRRVQDEVQSRVAEELRSRNMKPSGFSVSADYAKTTRVIKITGRSINPLEAQLAAKETTAVFKKTIEDVLMLDNVRLIDEASLPGAPDSMNRRIRTLIGLVFGFMAGIMLFIMLDYFDQTIKTPDDARNKLNIPVIGLIPFSEEGIRNSSGETRSNLGLVGFTEDKIAEAFRLVRTTLQYLALPKAGKARVFMFTSSVAREGKSSCLANLAMITAQISKKVLIIDADLRRPNVNKILDVPNDKGLVDVICNVATLDETIRRNVRNLSLDLLPSGTMPANPSELLMSKEFSQIVSTCREKYDYIFIDAPPAMMMSDPLVIGQYCDGVIFVVACASTKLDAIKVSLSQLEQTSIRVSGILLNKFSRERAGYGYYDYYNYNYDYGRYGLSGKGLKNIMPGGTGKHDDAPDDDSQPDGTDART